MACCFGSDQASSSAESPDQSYTFSLDVDITDSHAVKFRMHNSDNSAGLGKAVTKVYKNGVVMANTSGLVELAYVNHVLWQQNSSSNWYSLNTDGTTWAGPTKTNPLAKTPTPVPPTPPTPPQ